MDVPNEVEIVQGQRLGRLPGKSTMRALQFSDFMKYLQLPRQTNYWTQKTALPLRTFGNDRYGCCTRAKQAVAIMRMERIENRKLVEITDEEVIRVYTEMSARLYGGGDNGAYEDDALSEWRKPATTLRDTKGHSYTIDAYLKINPSNQDEIRAAIALSGARGIAVCFNLPLAFSDILPPADWAIPAGQRLTGKWIPGSWGGHSMWMHDYDITGCWLDHTWGIVPQRVTWEAVATYMDEAHVVIDSVDAWRSQPKSKAAKIDLSAVVDAVNSVSSYPVGGTVD
jgi:hypothetical protein